ncbi:DUF167 domain-containing protein [Tundrisphaera sp. TA3]|uniref:DUF167 domain-containing protein n=1 Tax=Tundrisphaera sp. TA3 TaxID=3435775 RepID=UPI003EBBFABB
MIDLARHAEGTIVPVRAQPNARKSAVLGERAGALRVGVTVAPERGKANEAIADVLAQALGCRASQVVLVAGATARDKRFLVVGLDPEALRLRIAPLIGA